MWAVVTLILIHTFGFGVILSEATEKQRGETLTSIGALAIELMLLYFGGFYDELLRRVFGG